MSFRQMCSRFVSLCVVVVVMTVWLLSSSASAETTLDVQAGYGGITHSGRPVPLFIEVTTDALFVGELRVISESTGFATTKHVEIPGGTTREFTIIWEGSPLSFRQPVVQLVTGGEVVASEELLFQSRDNTDLVGVFPDLVTHNMPNRVSVLFDAGDAILFRVDPARLAAGWTVLGPLDIIVITAADLRDLNTLDNASLDALLGWVNRGGTLLVDEQIGSEIPGLPEEWQPTGAQPRKAGQGEVRLTNGSAASGDWHTMFEPAPIRSREEQGDLTEIVSVFDRAVPLWDNSASWMSDFSLGGVSWSLAHYSDIELPDTKWIVAIILTYIAVAGPGVWITSRLLNRPGLGWVLMPVTAVAFSAGIWAFGWNFRSAIKPAHATIIEVAPRGTVATSFSMLNSTGGGRGSISLPHGWSVMPTPTLRDMPKSLVVDIADSDVGSTASTNLDAGAFTVIEAVGNHAEFDNALQVTARSSNDDQIAGTVVNNLPVDLHEVAILADVANLYIGMVPAGETVRFDSRFNHDYSAEATKLGIWSELRSRRSLNTLPTGEVTVAAWTDEFTSPLDSNMTTGQTLLLASGAIEVEGDTLSNLVVPRKIVRGPLDLMHDFEFDGNSGLSSMFRFVLPEAATGNAAKQDLVLEVPPVSRRVDLWTGTDWRQINLNLNDFNLNDFNLNINKSVFRLPHESISDGRVYLKVLFDGWPDSLFLREVAVRSFRDNDNLTSLWHDEDIFDFAEMEVDGWEKMDLEEWLTSILSPDNENLTGLLNGLLDLGEWTNTLDSLTGLLSGLLNPDNDNPNELLNPEKWANTLDNLSGLLNGLLNPDNDNPNELLNPEKWANTLDNLSGLLNGLLNPDNDNPNGLLSGLLNLGEWANTLDNLNLGEWLEGMRVQDNVSLFKTSDTVLGG